MKTRRKRNKPDLGRILGAVIFIVLALGLILLTLGYDPEAGFSGSFFEDVSDAIQWR